MSFHILVARFFPIIVHNWFETYDYPTHSRSRILHCIQRKIELKVHNIYTVLVI